MSQNSSRRDFMKATAAVSVAAWVGNERAPATLAAEERSPNAKVNYACIGVGGKGTSDSDDAAKHGQVVAICDVDKRILQKARTREGFEDAETYADFQEMLEEMGDKIDAVVISTPDHVHATAAAIAINKGKACFAQKPLTHNIWEARRLQDMAREKDVPTIMGNQFTAEDGLRQAAAVLKKGTLGKIKEAHIFTNRPVWPQGGERPEPQDVPSYLDWDLWLGPAPERPYAGSYHQFSWRGWWDFGTGALGDMACHTFNMPFAGLHLANAKTVQAKCTGHNEDSYPQNSTIVFEFDNPTQPGSLMPVHWYDGGNLPDVNLLKGYGFSPKQHLAGAIIVGEDLTLYSYGDYGAYWVLLDNDGKEVAAPEVEFEKSPGHFTEFHESIVGTRKRAMSNFEDYAGPLTETILLGNLAVYAAASGESKKIEWDAENLKATNAPELQKIVKREYRGNYGEPLGA